MKEKTQCFGSQNGLRIEVAWKPPLREASAADATWGELRLWVGGKLIWGRESETLEEHPVEWTWIELLEHLAFAWRYIEFEQGYPLGLRPLWPTDLHKAAEDRWEGMSDVLVRSQEDQLHAFIETHDLSRGIKGAELPSVYLVRLGNIMTIGTATDTLQLPLKETLSTLTALGDAIRDRLVVSPSMDPRADAAKVDWEGRRNVDQVEFRRIATGLDSQYLQEIGCPAAPLMGEDPNPFELTEGLALAGMARGHLGKKTLSDVLVRIKKFPKNATPTLDDLSDQAVAFFAEKDIRKPYEQGQVLADWLRAKLNIPKNSPNIEDILKQWNVVVQEMDLCTTALDAVACWGPQHGPLIVLNTSEKHSLAAVRRMTLAHEICHLLMDRRGALPLGEVVNGNVPRWFEQRADAFAAGFLLPLQMAARVAQQTSDTDELISKLTKSYVVSREVAAWQIRNSNVELSSERYVALRSLVSHPDRF